MWGGGGIEFNPLPDELSRWGKNYIYSLAILTDDYRLQKERYRENEAVFMKCVIGNCGRGGTARGARGRGWLGIRLFELRYRGFI